jgi:predicted ester cyclase
MAPETESVAARNKAIVLDAMERRERNDPTVYDEHPGFSETQRMRPRRMAAFPDLTIRVESVIAEGDRVALLCWATGTHRGDFAGIPATGKSVTYQVVVMDRLQDGKIVQHNASPDLMAVLVQLGALPLKPGS